MRNRLLLLLSVIALYLISAYAIHLVYGPSYPFLAGEDCWMPDNSGGWSDAGSRYSFAGCCDPGLVETGRCARGDF